MTALACAARLVTLALLISADLQGQRITRRESHGEVRNTVHVATVVAALDNSARITARLKRASPVTSDRIRIVDVRQSIAARRSAFYVAALQRNAARIQALRAELVTQDPVVRAPADTFRPTPAGLLSALQVAPEMVARVSALESLRLDRVRFYDIDAILKGADTELFRRAARLNESSIRSLRAELSKRPLVMHAMAQHDGTLVLGDIYAADILGEGDVLVLYFKRQRDAAAGST
jgi:hypothetical protein